MFFSNYSSHNHPKDFKSKYPDSRIYLTAIEDDLSGFVFSPKSFLWKYSRIYTIPFLRDNKTYIAVFLSSNSRKLNQPSISFYTVNGEEVVFEQEIHQPDQVQRVYTMNYKGGEHFAVLDGKFKSLYLYDSGFRFVKKYKPPFRLNLVFSHRVNGTMCADLNNNNSDELYFAGNGIKDVYVVSDNLDNSALFPIDDRIRYLFPVKLSKNQTQLWAITEKKLVDCNFSYSYIKLNLCKVITLPFKGIFIFDCIPTEHIKKII